MKTRMKITIAFVAVMVLSFTGYNVYKVQSTELLSDIAMANVEALANTGEGGSSTTYCCGNYGDCMKVMLPNGTTTVIKGIRLNSPCIN